MSSRDGRPDGLGRIDRRSAVPLHAQIDHLLRELIKAPKYAEGELLPDEVTLAKALSVSRNTIRAGMSRLIYEGAIERRPGIGTRVVHRSFHTGILEWHSLTREMASKGIQVQNFELTVENDLVEGSVASSLQVPSGTEVWRIRRIRGWQGERILLTISWVHPRLGLTGKECFDLPLYEVLQSVSGIRPERSHEDLSACLADESLAQDLAVEVGAPLLIRKRTTYDDSGRPIEFNLNWYRTEKHTLELDLRREP